MADIGIKSREELEAWLQDKPVEWAQVIAHRAAMRVLPLVALARKTDKLLELMPTSTFAIFRANFTLRVALKYPTRGLKAVTVEETAVGVIFTTAIKPEHIDKYNTVADVDIRSGIGFATDATGFTAESASSAAFAHIAGIYAVRAVAFAIFAADASAHTHSDLPALSSAKYTTARSAAVYDATNRTTAIWKTVSTDAQYLLDTTDTLASEHAKALVLEPLWHGTAPDWAMAEFRAMQEQLHYLKNQSLEWSLWYFCVTGIDGSRPRDYFSPELELRIATQSNKWWGRGASAVNADIAKWVEEEDIERWVVRRNKVNIAEFVIEFLSGKTEPSSNQQIYRAFDEAGYKVEVKSIRGALSRLASEKRIERIEYGLYRAVEAPTDASTKIEPEKSRALLSSTASPQPVANARQQLDAIPNSEFDRPDVDAELEELPQRQLAMIRQILRVLRPSSRPTDFNGPDIVVGVFEEYRDEIAANGVQPVLGLLRDQVALLESEMTKPYAVEEWLGQVKNPVAGFLELHELILRHFPLDKKREDEYAKYEIDGEQALDPHFVKQVSEATALAKAARDAGLTTDEYLRVWEKRLEAAKIASSLPVEAARKSGLVRRIFLTLTGYADKSVQTAEKIDKFAKTGAGAAFIEGAKRLGDFLWKSFTGA